MPKRTHPFKSWKRELGLTYAEIAAMCKRLGHQTSAAHLKQIANGRRWPRYPFGVALSVDVTGGRVTVDEFMTFGRKVA